MKSIIGIALFSFPLLASAELNVVSEVLIGKTQNQVHSSVLENEVYDEYYSSSLKSDSLGFRFGINVTKYFTFELSKHDHGDVVNNLTISIPTPVPGSPGMFYGPSEDTIVETNIPIDLESMKLGVKGKFELFTNTFINTRVGFVRWEYGKFTPQQLTLINIGAPSKSGKSGNDIYYSLGTEYKFTENLYLGFEFSLFTINENSYYKSSLGDSYVGNYKHDVKDLSLVLGWVF